MSNRKKRAKGQEFIPSDQLKALNCIANAIAKPKPNLARIELRCGGEIVIPLSPIRRAGFDVDGLFASMISHKIIGRAEDFFYAYCRFDEPGRSDKDGAYNGFDLLDDLLAYSLAGASMCALHSVEGHA